MGKTEFFKKSKNVNNPTKDKYQTECYIRQKSTPDRYYNTAPPSDSKPIHQCQPKIENFEFSTKNLHIKSCACGNREIFIIQSKKPTFRNYKPKILSQEVSMGMWM